MILPSITHVKLRPERSNFTSEDAVAVIAVILFASFNHPEQKESEQILRRRINLCNRNLGKKNLNMSFVDVLVHVIGVGTRTMRKMTTMTAVRTIKMTYEQT